MTKEQAAAAIAEILKPFRVDIAKYDVGTLDRDKQVGEILAIVIRDLDVHKLCICPACFMAYGIASVWSAPEADEEDDDVSIAEDEDTDPDANAAPSNEDLDQAAAALACAISTDEVRDRSRYLRKLLERRTHWVTEDDIALRTHIEEMLSAASMMLLKVPANTVVSVTSPLLTIDEAK